MDVKDYVKLLHDLKIFRNKSREYFRKKIRNKFNKISNYKIFI